jgi:cytochrome c
MMFVRSLSLLTVLALASAVFAGCSKSAKKSAGDTMEQPMGAGPHAPVMLDDADRQMMKNGAMKNMDRVMMQMKPGERGQYITKAQDASIERGQQLFNDKSALSANGMACAGCHPGGGTTGGEAETPMKSELTGMPYKLPIPTLAGASARFPKYKVPNDAVITLEQMNNNCIMMFLMAKPLPLNTQESRDLAAYVTSLSSGEQVEVPAPMMMMN